MDSVRSSFAPVGHERVIAICERMLLEDDALPFIAYYDRGFPAFTISKVSIDERNPWEKAFRRFVSETIRLDAPLRPLGTGKLIRTVIEFEDGAACCLPIFAEEYLVGGTRDAVRIDEMDISLRRLATQARVKVYLQPDQLPGGYHEVDPGQPRLSDPVHIARGPVAERGLQTPLTELAAKMLSATDLQYLAVHRDGDPIFSADVYESSALSPWIGGHLAPEGARQQYLDLAAVIRVSLPEITHSLRTFTDRSLRRLVLDVEAGAIYVYLLPRHRVLIIGVTVAQPAVYTAEVRLREVVRRVDELLQG
ncbi:hypothetical protein [Nonomuraea sp. NPDC050540]|uniref:hypothetical protein n=1 Tax=Nonomuraea sp. NPDC050540 TaxID=3364367 RepID=UPI003799F2C5